ncbi:uncharacterized protein [Parasteatoda tepidariorum]|uniref:uncharacterized protein n=1 Tax=Parasteatoda tepidariorum TaxID=114398 RepID=UPI00077FB217|nr:uncharacterized protein LOC107456931 [Parasteatoda tepidariorum]
MSCSFSPKGYKAFLVCCNVALLFVGSAIFILGLKMKWTVESLLMTVPVLAKAFKAVISTGFFVSVAGITGITGACYEILWLISVHLFFLAVIVIMEFALGVTLMVIKTTIESYIESDECSYSCAVTLDAVVLDYALPSTGLMMTIIIVEALMIYSAIHLYFHIRDSLKTGQSPRNSPNLQMLDVSMPQSPFPHSPRPGYSPRLSNSRLAHPMYSPNITPGYPSPLFSPKPPEYMDFALSSEQQPPSYFDVVPSDINRSPLTNLA